jgi:hypothetical protein
MGPRKRSSAISGSAPSPLTLIEQLELTEATPVDRYD